MFGLIPAFQSVTLARASSKLRLEAAGNTAGWMTYAELIWLAREASKHHTIVEIGSYLGRSTRAMADNSEAVVYAVDDFKGPRDKGMPAMPVYELFLHSTIDLIQAGRVVPVIADHADVPELPRPDMVFLDGDHSHAAVTRDIRRWAPSLLPGGIICGHDSHMSDVMQAVDESFHHYRLAPGTSIWYAYV